MNNRFGMVIVTYNRLEKLKTVLERISSQSVAPDVVIVFDNHSTDGSDKVLDEWKAKQKFKTIVHHNDTNLGGSGGFANGLKMMLEEDVDWIYLGDDDAYPNTDLIEKFKEYVFKHQDEIDGISSISTRVDDPMGISFFHRKNIIRGKLKPVEVFSVPSDYEKEEFEATLFSFVGVILNKTKAIQAGLPRQEFFIIGDDTEYALRISKLGKNICVPSLKVLHDSMPILSNDIDITWKVYYGYRNMFEIYMTYFGKSLTGSYMFFKFLKARLKLFKYLITFNKVNFNKQQIFIMMLKDARSDFKKHKFGISEKYPPGKKFEI